MARLLPLLAFAALVTGCAPSPAGDSGGARPDSVTVTPAPAAATATISGTVTYRQRIALPPDADVTVTLSDVSRVDAAAVGLGEVTFKSEGRQVPLPFSISYDPASIDTTMTYGLRARVLVGEKLVWISDSFVPVLTRGARRDSVEVGLVQVP